MVRKSIIKTPKATPTASSRISTGKAGDNWQRTAAWSTDSASLPTGKERLFRLPLDGLVPGPAFKQTAGLHVMCTRLHETRHLGCTTPATFLALISLRGRGEKRAILIRTTACKWIAAAADNRDYANPTCENSYALEMKLNVTAGSTSSLFFPLFFPLYLSHKYRKRSSK